MRIQSALWNHFDKDVENVQGVCRYCSNSFSYRTTIANLKEHLRRKHRTAYDELVAVSGPGISKPRGIREERKKALLWKYFNRIPNKRAICQCCFSSLSYTSTTANLYRHLKNKHADVYENMDKDVEEDEVEDPEESLKLSAVWSYFEQDSDQTACCVVCRSDVTNSYDALKAHLQESHPKLLLQAMQDNEQNSDEASNADDNETYTEIVYLEQEPVEPSKPKHSVKKAPKSPKKRQRIDSVDEPPLKRSKEQTHTETDELGAFLQYIGILLKKLPQEAFSKVQIEIINTILKANTPSESRIVTEVNGGSLNVMSLSDIAPVASNHNYTITVGTTKHNETDDGSLS